MKEVKLGLQEGYQFRYPELAGALEDLLILSG
ncbi:DUF1731 domain-containing protein [Neomoorella mulderi]|nr:DUF1731 domain-containing protein [Moorella mulderi]